MSSLFDVEAFGQRGESHESITQLPGTLKNNFGAVVVIFYLALDLNHFTGQLPYIADLLQIVRKDNHRE